MSEPISPGVASFMAGMCYGIVLGVVFAVAMRSCL